MPTNSVRCLGLPVCLSSAQNQKWSQSVQTWYRDILEMIWFRFQSHRLRLRQHHYSAFYFYFSYSDMYVVYSYLQTRNSNTHHFITAANHPSFIVPHHLVYSLTHSLLITHDQQGCKISRPIVELNCMYVTCMSRDAFQTHKKQSLQVKGTQH